MVTELRRLEDGQSAGLNTGARQGRQSAGAFVAINNDFGSYRRGDFRRRRCAGIAARCWPCPGEAAWAGGAAGAVAGRA